MTMQLPPAGWYPDPHGGPGQMYWDGEQWHAETSATPQFEGGFPSPGNQPPQRGPRRALIAVIGSVLAAVIIGLVVVLLVVHNRHTNSAAQPSSTSQPVTSVTTVTQTTATPAPPPPPPAVVHYTETETTTGGFSHTNDWYLTPCGDGCVEVASASGAQPFGEARLVNGQWTMNATANAVCQDGTSVENAYSDFYSWDPDTLAGTVRVTANLAACGNPAGNQPPVSMQLTKTS